MVRTGSRCGELADEVVVAHAADAGYRLVRRELDTGNLVWEWCRGHDPRPLFMTRRVALQWMAKELERGRLG
jgi:hypothetical protein